MRVRVAIPLRDSKCAFTSPFTAMTERASSVAIPIFKDSYAARPPAPGHPFGLELAEAFKRLTLS